jgi:hypothetical protein
LNIPLERGSDNLTTQYAQCFKQNLRFALITAMENKRKGPVVDNRSVDTGDDYAIDYWLQELKTTKNKLLAAVAEVGDDFETVKRQLKKN